MIRVKKILFLILALSIVTFTFANVRLIFWHSMSDYQKPALDKLVADFNASHPRIHVIAVYEGNYDQMVTKLKTALLSNRAPDIVQLNIEHLRIFTANDQLFDLSGYISKDPELRSDFVDSFWKTVVINDKVYALPFNISCLMFYYNKDLFQRAGLDPNKPPRTWKEMEEMAKKLTIRNSPNAKPSQYGLFWGVDGQDTAFYQFEPLIWENGGRVFNSSMTTCVVNQLPAVEALKIWKHWFDMGISPPNMTYQEGIQAFMMGKIAMGPMSSGGTRYGLDNLPWDLGVAMLPSHKATVTTLGGGSIAIINGISKERRDAAWEFMKWITNTKNTLYWYENTGYLPVRKSALNSLQIRLIWKKFPQLKPAIEAIPYARPRPVNVDIIQIRHILYTAIEEVKHSVETPQQAFNDAAKKVNEILRKEKSK